MKYIARVEVGLKPGHSDPEGKTTKDSLVELNYPVHSVKVIKVFEINVEVSTLEEAKNKVEEMCKRLLANPVKDYYTFKIEEV